MAKKKEQQVECSENKLKKLSVEQIEQAVRKAINELVGDEYYVNINRFNFENSSFGLESCQIDLSVENQSDFDDDIPF